ncbi:histone deacetylase [Nocardioides aurantiacus]|uniref:Histone deacetylase n=1 Tax=Nocardioides aurantiacus TaxID=86796 RepID=A0A3N2CXL5_9ACTN|nr:histone deacetylase [Nocardioides aurantiacus]ROR92236.1 hypothetical protein EDD33_3123 [Nocardioides aurantiacus]
MSVTPEAPLVWYVSYGSNMAADRLAAYLAGGVPAGGRRANPGARDATPPRRSEPVDLPGALYFAGESPQWGGGVAFYDHDATDRGPTAARAYLVTAAQFADVAAQEMHRVPAEGDPVEQVLLDGFEGRHEVGPGRYETLLEVGRLEGLPLLVFTSPHGIDAVPHTQPAPHYLAMLATGLRESRGWDEARFAAYVDRVRGTVPPS